MDSHIILGLTLVAIAFILRVVLAFVEVVKED